MIYSNIRGVHRRKVRFGDGSVSEPKPAKPKLGDVVDFNGTPITVAALRKHLRNFERERVAEVMAAPSADRVRSRRARRDAEQAAKRGPAHRVRGIYGTPSALDALEGLTRFFAWCDGVDRHEWEAT